MDRRSSPPILDKALLRHHTLVKNPPQIKVGQASSRGQRKPPYVEHYTDSITNLDPSQHAVHSRLRRLSSSHSPHERYCSKCHMRRPSQELLFAPSDVAEDFCPDIVMPKAQRPIMHHARRHSGLCPDNMVAHELSDGTHSPTQITLKSKPCSHNSSSSATGYHHDCHCETVTPVDNLSARYGQIEDPARNVVRRKSTEKEAMDLVHEIMHEELLADMEAKQSRL